MKTIIFDIDGTLANVEHRKHHLPNWDKFFAEMHKDPVIEPVAWLAKTLYHASAWTSRHAGEVKMYQVLVVSARPEDYRDVTEQWLKENVIRYDKLYMRKAGDYRQDSIVKSEILEQILADGYDPFLVVDDRPQVVDMWRSWGICTLQCDSDEVRAKHEGVQCLDILVGPAGSGKSTYAASQYQPQDILSSDAIREQYGWGHSPEDLNRTWNYVHSLLKARLDNHIKTVLDATNIKRKDRLKILSNVPKGQYVRYIVIDRDLDEKLRDRGWRSEDLVLKHHRTFQSQLSDILKGDEQANVVVLDKRSKK